MSIPKNIVLGAVLIASAAELGFMAYTFRPEIPSAPSLSLPALAAGVVEACAEAKSRASCYDEEIPKLMDRISMEEAFQVTSLVQDADREYRYCHVLGHKLSAREVAKDPSKWKDVVVRCPSGVCSNGCIHGGFQERFRAESFTDEQINQVKPDLYGLCEKKTNWNPTGLEQASCYHALGHLSMYLTSAEIKKAIPLCAEVSKKEDGRDYSQLCFDGAFMQIFQPLEPDDFALIKGKEVDRDEVDRFCADFTGMAKGSCQSESWPLYRPELMKPEGLIKFCGKTEPAERQRCFSALIYVLTAQFGLDEKRVGAYCAGMPADLQPLCYANGSSRLIETDYRNAAGAVAICESAPEAPQKACYEELLKYSTYNFHVGSEPFRKLCDTMPAPWRDRCLQGKRP